MLTALLRPAAVRAPTRVLTQAARYSSTAAEPVQDVKTVGVIGAGQMVPSHCFPLASSIPLTLPLPGSRHRPRSRSNCRRPRHPRRQLPRLPRARPQVCQHPSQQAGRKVKDHPRPSRRNPLPYHSR